MCERTENSKGFPVRMYVTDISQSDVFYDMWYSRMPGTRQAKADRFRLDKDRKRCIASYALLAYAMSDLDGTSWPYLPDRITDRKTERKVPFAFTKKEGGKPYFTDIPLYFNISHSGDKVAVSISPDEVGCDVEYKSKNAVSVAEHFFSEYEVSFLKNINDEKRQGLEFKRLWTMKESVVKCSGEGIRRPFGDFSLISGTGEKIRHITLPGRSETFHVAEYEPEGGYCFSVCSLHEDIEDKIRYVRLEDE